MKKIIKILITTLVVVMLFVFSFSFVACGFPLEIEDGRFNMTRSRLIINDQELTQHNSTRVMNDMLNWMDNTFETLRLQVPETLLPIFNMAINYMSIELNYELTEYLSHLREESRMRNEGRFLVIRNGQFISSSRIGGYWVENNLGNFTLEDGRFIGIHIMYDRTNKSNSYYRAFTQNRIVRTDAFNIKYEVIGQVSWMMSWGFGANFSFDSSKVRDFWITEQLTFFRGEATNNQARPNPNDTPPPWWWETTPWW